MYNPTMAVCAHGALRTFGGVADGQFGSACSAGPAADASELCAVERSKLSPLEVLLAAMRSNLAGGKLKEAADIAKAAAPYLHAKATGRGRAVGIAMLRDDELAALEKSTTARTGAAAENQNEVRNLDTACIGTERAATGSAPLGADQGIGEA